MTSSRYLRANSYLYSGIHRNRIQKHEEPKPPYLLFARMRHAVMQLSERRRYQHATRWTGTPLWRQPLVEDGLILCRY